MNSHKNLNIHSRFTWTLWARQLKEVLLSNFLSCPLQAAPVRCALKDEAEQAMPRRAMVAAAAAAMLAVAAAPAVALGPQNEPPITEKGRKNTIKKYANICVSQPTASVCHG